MAEYCILGYLNIFVMPTPDGWGLDTTISSWLNTNKRMTHTEVHQAIQDGAFEPPVKSLSPGDVRTIMDWMYANDMIGKPENESITYVPAGE